MRAALGRRRDAGARNIADERDRARVSAKSPVHYPGGIGQSKLRIRREARGTARNMNSVTKLAELAKEQA